MRRNRAERRFMTRVKQHRREELMRRHGQQSGLLYEKHRKKINASTGYMRDGNLSHYAAVGFHQKTRDHNRYGAVLMPCKRDKAKREEQRQQVAEYITDWRDCR